MIWFLLVNIKVLENLLHAMIYLDDNQSLKWHFKISKKLENVANYDFFAMKFAKLVYHIDMPILSIIIFQFFPIYHIIFTSHSFPNLMYNE